jgi:hypothetical protein
LLSPKVVQNKGRYNWEGQTEATPTLESMAIFSSAHCNFNSRIPDVRWNRTSLLTTKERSGLPNGLGAQRTVNEPGNQISIWWNRQHKK